MKRTRAAPCPNTLVASSTNSAISRPPRASNLRNVMKDSLRFGSEEIERLRILFICESKLKMSPVGGFFMSEIALTPTGSHSYCTICADLKVKRILSGEGLGAFLPLVEVMFLLGCQNVDALTHCL